MAPKKDKVLPPSSKPAKSGGGKQKKKNATGVAYVLHACSKLNSEGQKCDEGTEAELAFPDDPRRQDSATFGDFVTSETDEVINAQTQRMQTEGEVECHWNMETLDIVQEEGITSAYEEQHSGKFQPKPRLLDTVIEEEPGSHYSVDDTTGANQSECMVNEESRNDECTNTAFYGEYQEEEHNIPQVHKESAPDVLEQEHRVVSPSNNDTVMGQGETQFNEAETRTDKKGEKKRGRKKKATTNEEEANKSPGKKKLKHSSRRQKNTLEKELLETPDDDIKHLPIRDMLRLVAYRESLEKKEAKGAPVVPPTQESNNTNASWDNQYYSQGFDAQDEFGMEEGENHVQVKPDSPVNYQTYMKKTPRTRWSKQETQVFYEGIQAFGINLSMVQQFLPKRRTLHQIKLKYKLEERKNPLKIDDALSTPCKDLTRYHIVLKKLQQEAAAAKEEEEPGEEAETTSDVPENEEQTKSDERAGDGVAGVKESDGEDVENGVRSDGGDQFDENEGDDDDFWNSYKSEM
uniref:Myb-like domain-containing protein n=1 Tax=Brassica oleracea var. oleracea TaxID=109376 RepID=A0A0D2ZTL2_BRAOL